MANPVSYGMKLVYTIMFWFSIALVAASVVLLVLFGLNFGVDFRGGSVVEFSFSENRPPFENVKSKLAGSGFSEITINYFGDDGIILRARELTEKEHQDILSVLKNNFPQIEEKKFESVGPVIGKELKNKSVVAISLVLFAVVVYIAIVFRKVSKTLSPWVMGFAAVIALLHDVIIPLGVFAVLGKFYGVEISAVFVAAVLTILGYSVSDTVVVFDRVRENVIRGNSGSFPAIVHRSILQTLTRSLNTTFTTLLSLFAIYFFGGESIRYFALALIIGIFLGAYSSIFVASPLMVWLSRK